MQKCAPVQIWGQSVLEIHGSCDGISVATSRRFFRTNLSSEREDTPRYNTIEREGYALALNGR